MLLCFLRFKKYILALSTKLVKLEFGIIWWLACGWEMMLLVALLSSQAGLPGQGMAMTYTAQTLGIATTLFRPSCSWCQQGCLGWHCSSSAKVELPEWLSHSSLKDVLSLGRATSWTLCSEQIAAASPSHHLFCEVFCLCFLTWGIVFPGVFSLLVSISSVFEVVTCGGAAVFLVRSSPRLCFSLAVSMLTWSSE